MLSKKVSVAGARLASPADPLWSGAEHHEVELIGVSASMQPSIYLSTAIKDRPIGAVNKVRVASLHDGNDLYIRMVWEQTDQCCEISDITRFPDGAAVLFPLLEDAPLMTMGAADKPVNGWHWRADRPDVAYNNIATGLGTTEVTDKDGIQAGAVYENGQWQLVLRRQLAAAKPDSMKPFAVGAATKMAFAVWGGGNGERGGLKAFSPQWLDLQLES